jgi:tetratricopeptide (TPR) repeat protein
LYAKSAFNEAIGQYDKALASCPNYLDYEVAVLKSNIAACHIKLAEWKEAAEAASKAIEGLERVMPSKKKSTATHNGKADGETTPSMTGPASANSIDTTPDPDAPVVELPDDDDDGAKALAALQLSAERRSQVRSLRAKSLMRRARANVELGGWAALAAAEQDYKEVLGLQIVPKADERFIQQQLTLLPLEINAAKEKEMAEMMGKLKEVSRAQDQISQGLIVN